MNLTGLRCVLRGIFKCPRGFEVTINLSSSSSEQFCGFKQRGHGGVRTTLSPTVDNHMIHCVLPDVITLLHLTRQAGFFQQPVGPSARKPGSFCSSDAPVELQYVAHDPPGLPGIHVTLFHIATMRDKMFWSGYITDGADVIAPAAVSLTCCSGAHGHCPR